MVAAIIVFLIALLFPGLSAARERARRMVCANNLRQWGVACHMYRDDSDDYLPTEGTYISNGINKPNTWYNALPSYLGLPSYRDLDRDDGLIRELPNIHVWICPSKNLSDAYKSDSGMNQFHYGMNQVLDGMGSVDNPSPDTPDFPDLGSDPIRAGRFATEPQTVFMFDIAPNSPAGSPRDVGTQYARNWEGKPLAKFHGDYFNVLYLAGGVTGFRTSDVVPDCDLRRGDIRWNHPSLYWGYRPPLLDEEVGQDEVDQDEVDQEE